MKVSLGTPVADSSPPVDAPPPIEADMTGRPQTRAHLLGLPFPNRGSGFAGEGNEQESRSGRLQDSWAGTTDTRAGHPPRRG